MVDRVNVSMNAANETDEAKSAREEHDRKMIEVAENGTTSILHRETKDGETSDVIDLRSQEPGGDDNNDKPQRPEGIPEKFWNAEKGEVNVEALLKAQQDGERAIRELQANKKPDDKSTKEGDDTGEQEENDQSNQENVVAKASAEWSEKGELSAETYSALEGVGLSKEMVDQYIEGQKAIVASLQNAAYGEFGGTKDNYEKARDWAVENLTEAELEAIDVQITSTNPAIVAQGAKALAAKYNANADLDPNVTIQGGGNAPTSGAYFKSGAEMQAAMSDPRYKKDEAFRAEVAQKIERAEKRGVNLFS